MDWDGLCDFLREIKVFLEKTKRDKRDAVVVESLIEKCEFYLSTTPNLRFNDDQVDNGNNGNAYLNMASSTKIMVMDVQESTEQSEYIDMDDYGSLPTPPSPSNMSPAECPYMGLPFVHLKLNKSVLIVQENTKITGRKVTVTCALLKGCWLLYYYSNKPNALKPDKSFQVDHLEVPTSPEQALQLTLFCCQDPPQTLHFESGTMREMWIKAIREELPILEDGVYDDPNNLRMDEHLYKTIKFDYDIPKMPPKPVDGQQQQHQQQQQEPRQNQRMSPNADFQLKCQVISEQLDSQLKNQKGGVTAIERRQRSNSIISPQKKFGLFMFNMFRSTTSSGSNSPPMQEVSASNHPKKTTPEKTAKILKCKRNTTIFSPDYEIVGS